MAIMSSSSLLSLLLLLLASAASARPGLPFHPCKTLLISTYSVSFQPRNPQLHDRPQFVAVVAQFRQFHPNHQSIPLDSPGFFPDGPGFRPRHPYGDDQAMFHRPSLALGSSSSLRDRTLDVLNVLASLLFGAACGALTAGTMYLIWSLFNGRFEAYRSLDDFSDDEDDDDDDDIFNPKKPQNNNEVHVSVPAAPCADDSTETALLKKESA